MQVGFPVARRQPFAGLPARTRGAVRAPRRRVGFAGIWRFRSPKPDVLASSAGPLSRERRLARVEAVLFLAREPVSSRKIAQLASLADGTEARTLVRRLNQLLDGGGSAFRIEEVAGGFQMLTRPMFGPWLRRLLQNPVEMRLSVPAMETLAVVAYRGPVLRADIEAIRGVQCGDILRQLMDRDLVRIVSRSNDLGRPLLYGTTKRFLQIFGLRNLDELPMATDLRRPKQTDPAATPLAATTAPPHLAAPDPLSESMAHNSR
jgi:segregation and condensation protein B